MVEPIWHKELCGWSLVNVGYGVVGREGILAQTEWKERRRSVQKEEGANAYRLSYRYLLSCLRNPSQPWCTADITGSRLRLGIDACLGRIESDETTHTTL